MFQEFLNKLHKKIPIILLVMTQNVLVVLNVSNYLKNNVVILIQFNITFGDKRL